MRAPAGLPRLLPLVPGVPEDLRAHLARYGRPPYRGGRGLLIQDVEAAGLTGRGGAAFPVHRKLAIVARARGRKVIVANGAESEPASRKDALLLRVAPNLVLDGLQLAAEAVGATEAHLYLHPGAGQEICGRWPSATPRASTGSPPRSPRLRRGSWPARSRRWSTGSAAARPLPTFVPPRVSERGLGGAPTLVQNVETLAHLALIARYGPRWFRAARHRQGAGQHAHHRAHQADGQPRSSRPRSAPRCAPWCQPAEAAPRRSSSAASTAPGCPPAPSGHAHPRQRRR